MPNIPYGRQYFRSVVRQSVQSQLDVLEGKVVPSQTQTATSESSCSWYAGFRKEVEGWVFSQAFFREELFKELGMEKTEDVIGFMKDYFYRREANDLLGMLATWQSADISNNNRFAGDFDKALQSISARAIVMPGKTDLYFRVTDSE